MGIVKSFNKPNYGQSVHLSHLIQYTHAPLFQGVDLKPFQKPVKYNGQQFSLPESDVEARHRILKALLDGNALILINTIFEKQIKVHNDAIKRAESDMTRDQRVAMALSAMQTTMVISQIMSSIREGLLVQYPAVGRLRFELLDKGDAKSAETLFRCMEERARRLRRHYGSEWVEVKTDHNLSNVILTNLKRMERFMGISGDTAPESTALPFKPV